MKGTHTERKIVDFNRELQTKITMSNNRITTSMKTKNFYQPYEY